MYPVPGRCPVCSSELVVTHIQCRTCGVELSGNFSLARFCGLGSEQVQFVELLIKNRGNVSKVGEDMGIPYSAARGRLDEIIRVLGYEVEEEPALSAERRREILDQVASHEMTVEEAARLFRRA